MNNFIFNVVSIVLLSFLLHNGSSNPKISQELVSMRCNLRAENHLPHIIQIRGVMKKNEFEKDVDIGDAVNWYLKNTISDTTEEQYRTTGVDEQTTEKEEYEDGVIIPNENDTTDVVEGFPPGTVQLFNKEYIPLAGGKYFCIGHFISRQHILTLATCVTGYDELLDDYFITHPSIITVRYLTPQYNAGGEVAFIKKICVHPRYYINERGIPLTDVAVVTLSRPINQWHEHIITPIFPLIKDYNWKKINLMECVLWSWAGMSGNNSIYLSPINGTISLNGLCKSEYPYFDSKVALCSMDKALFSQLGAGIFCDNKMVGMVSLITSSQHLIYARVDNLNTFLDFAMQSFHHSTKSSFSNVVALALILFTI